MSRIWPAVILILMLLAVGLLLTVPAHSEALVVAVDGEPGLWWPDQEAREILTKLEAYEQLKRDYDVLQHNYRQSYDHLTTLMADKRTLELRLKSQQTRNWFEDLGLAIQALLLVVFAGGGHGS